MGDIMDDGRGGRYETPSKPMQDRFTPVEEAVQDGLNLLILAGEESANRKEDIDPSTHPKTAARWEAEWGWAYKWWEKINIESLDMGDTAHWLLAQILGEADWERVLSKAHTGNNFCGPAKYLAKFPMRYGMRASVTERGYWNDWSAKEAANHGFPANMPENKAWLGHKYVDEEDLWQAYDAAWADLTSAWKLALRTYLESIKK